MCNNLQRNTFFLLKNSVFFKQCMQLMLKDLSPELGNYCFKTWKIWRRFKTTLGKEQNAYCLLNSPTVEKNYKMIFSTQNPVFLLARIDRVKERWPIRGGLSSFLCSAMKTLTIGWDGKVEGKWANNRPCILSVFCFVLKSFSVGS